MERKPIKIIFDTDMGGDCDDVGALAMLHRLCDQGEAELLAVTHCCSSPYLAGCIDAINTYYNRRVPIGLNYAYPLQDRGVYAGELCERYPNDYPPQDYPNEEKMPDSVKLIRRILANAEDNSITLVVTGLLMTMAGLVLSQPDEISPLSGKELIEKKLARTVLMGGRFFETWPMDIMMGTMKVTWEWNIKGGGLQIAQTVFDKWPSELVFSSFEIGLYITTMVDYPNRTGLQSPVAMAYEIHNQGRGRFSWDQTAMLEAVRPNVYWNYHEHGKISVDENLITHWKKDKNGKHTYLLPKVDYAEIRQVIDDLVDGK